jgi:phosphoribosylanthranilate isomerase
MRTWIKFCGTTSAEDALASIEAGADALGFIFAPSKRRVTPEQAEAITAKLPARIERIGVFQNEAPERVRAIVEQVGLTAVQLHGGESPAYVQGLFDKWVRNPHIGVIKTLLMDSFVSNFAILEEHLDCFDCLLFDSGAGSGKRFDWTKLLQRFNDPKQGPAGFKKRFIIAGGLNPENVAEAVAKFHPWGVDVVSGVEREPGRKDPEKLKSFVAAVRKAEQS